MLTYEFPQLSVSVEIVVFALVDQRLQAFLIEQCEGPTLARWKLPGGRVRAIESLDDAAVRVLADEVGLSTTYLEQLYTFGDPQRDPHGRVISVTYLALIRADNPLSALGDLPAAGARWFPIVNLPELAFDHAAILDYALQRLRFKLEYTSVGFELLPVEFTLSQLQSTYEIILGVELDRRNFRRRILEAGVIEATTAMRGGEGRPARLFRFKQQAAADTKPRRLSLSFS